MTGQRIAVLGAGPGGLAAAAGITERGHEVTLFSRSTDRLRPVQEANGVDVTDKAGTRHVEIHRVTSDVAAAVAEADAVLLAVPAYGQEEMVRAIAPHLHTDSVLVLMPGSAGSLIAHRILEEHGLDPRADVLLGETITLPYSGRMIGPAAIKVVLPSRLRAAAMPSSRNGELERRLQGVLDLHLVANVLDPGLNNPNFLIHPAPMLLNYAEIERREGRLSIMNEGMTPGVLRCLDAMDAEKMRVCAALGLESVSIDQVYTEAGGSPSVYRNPGEPFGLTDRIWPRYTTEDVPYGSVMIASLARHLGQEAPISDGVSHLLSVADGTDYWSVGRTVERLGLSTLDVTGIVEFLATGGAPAGTSAAPGAVVR